ncbi:hypothetical protein BaRGS_00014914, partial [Batillaria attramentaria]
SSQVKKVISATVLLTCPVYTSRTYSKRGTPEAGEPLQSSARTNDDPVPEISGADEANDRIVRGVKSTH